MKTEVVAQVLVYTYNNRSNGWGGQRDIFHIIDIIDPRNIVNIIKNQLGELVYKGYVLVKYAGRMFLCENNNNDPTFNFLRHEIHYHPLNKYFSV